MGNKQKHLELLQGVINRLSMNSFLLKGWSVALVSALFAISVPESRVEFAFLAYVPAIIFWGLDGFFLWQEQLFRAHYDYVRKLPEDQVDFSMDTSEYKKVKNLTWGHATLSKTMIPFHGALLFAVFIVMVANLSAQG